MLFWKFFVRARYDNRRYIDKLNATNEPVKTAIKRKTKQSFRLSVKITSVVGKSVIAAAYPHTCVQPISGKFYSKYQCVQNITQHDLQRFNQQYTTGPKDKYTQPLLESHKYGWYHNVRFDQNIDYSALLNV